jgi:amino acid transporter
MGREGVLPAWLGKTHPRFQTPANATLMVAVISTLAAALIGFTVGDVFGGATTTVYYFYATLGTLCVIVVYLGLCVGGMAYFRRFQNHNPLVHYGVPLIGLVIFAAALYGSVHPTPPWPLDLTPYITVAWLVIGIVVVMALRARNPEAVERIGSILGEEGGEDAAIGVPRTHG